MKKILGKTTIQISAIGFGTGDFFWDSDLSDTQKVELIRLAIEKGINIVDTAEEYGNGSSEVIVGEATQDIRDQVVIASKFSPQHHSHEDVLRCCDESLKRLKTDFIDIYQIHWPNPAIPLKETMEALINLYQDGKIRAIGISNYSLRGIKKAQKYLGNILLSSLQMEYNLFERTIEENGILSYCKKNNISLLAYSPLDQGQMSVISHNRKALLMDIAKKHGRSLHQIILNFIISRSPVVAIMRTTSKRHLVENVQAMTLELSKKEVRLIEKTFPIEYYYIPINRIKVSLSGEWNHMVYQTLDQAIENKLGFTPSPKELAKSINKGDYLKPVRLKRSKDSNSSYDFDLVGGRIRYWAWVIAHGEKCPEIPAYIRENYLN